MYLSAVSLPTKRLQAACDFVVDLLKADADLISFLDQTNTEIALERKNLDPGLLDTSPADHGGKL